MRERTLALSGQDAENLAAVLAHAEARFAIAGDKDLETWSRGMLDKLREAE